MTMFEELTDLEDNSVIDCDRPPPTATQFLPYLRDIRKRFVVSFGEIPDEIEELMDRLRTVPNVQSRITDFDYKTKLN